MKVLCLDIGASSGRFIVVNYENAHFTSDEVYRFPNVMEKDADGHLIWNFDKLINEVKIGLKLSLTKYKDISSLGIDTWGVDYGILNKSGKLTKYPFAYRDYRCEEAMNKLLSKKDYKEIYEKSGIQKLAFNTLFQLYDDSLNKRDIAKILLIPDLIAYFLTGKQYIELTNLSTTSLYNPIKKDIDEEMTKLAMVDRKIFPELILPGQEIGYLKDEIVEELGIYRIKVIATASHDSACAIASIPLKNDSCYISSGTWSLLGVELKDPIINEVSYKNNFTNEIGYNHSIRFLKNIIGLFIIQEYRKSLIDRGVNISFKEMLESAKSIKNNEIFIDINNQIFSTPFDMEDKLIKYLKKTKQRSDLSIGEMCLAIYESMAFKYFEEFKKLIEITKHEYKELVIVGGGSNVDLLNQLTSNILNIDVVEGEKEATVYGNALIQFMKLNEFKDLNEARAYLKKDHSYMVYHPQNHDFYLKKYSQYKEIMERK